MLYEALEKASLATRSTIENLSRKYIIDNNTEVKSICFASKIRLVSFGIGSGSKKSKLTKLVFKKIYSELFHIAFCVTIKKTNKWFLKYNY